MQSQPSPKRSAAEMAARVRSAIIAFTGREPVATARRVTKQDETPPALKSHPEYKESFANAIAFRARAHGWNDGLDAAERTQGAPKR